VTTTSARASAVSTGAGLLLFVSVVAVGLQLRPAVATVPPLLDVLRERNGLAFGGAILLTTLPVVCFGLTAALAPAVDRRWGAERGILWCLVLLGGGLVFRAAVPGVVALLAGTAVAAAAIGVLHVLLPALFKRRAPEAVAALTTAMSVTIGVGAAVSATLVVPAWQELSLGVALGLWGAVAFVVAGLWLPQSRSRAVAVPAASAGGSLYRDGLAWQVTLYFGLQSVAYYALLSWLPTYFQERDLGRTAAGVSLAVLALAGVAGSLLAKPLAARLPDQRPAAVVGGVLGLAGLAGVQLLPDGLALGAVALLGVGLGMALNTSLLLTTLRAGDPPTAARLSGMAQTVGYLMAALGPFAFGGLRAVTGGWTVPLLLLGLVLVGDLLAGLAAGRAKTVASG
jgi:CP family cyanate transporter-like MFS transporter